MLETCPELLHTHENSQRERKIFGSCFDETRMGLVLLLQSHSNTTAESSNLRHFKICLTVNSADETPETGPDSEGCLPQRLPAQRISQLLPVTRERKEK